MTRTLHKMIVLVVAVAATGGMIDHEPEDGMMDAVSRLSTVVSMRS